MSRFVVNPNFRAEIRKEPEYPLGLEECTKPAAAAAKAIAPVGDPADRWGPYPGKGHPGKPGDYKKSIKATIVNGSVYLTATDYKAFWIEMGTEGDTPTPVFATLRRGVRIAGLKFRPRK